MKRFYLLPLPTPYPFNDNTSKHIQRRGNPNPSTDIRFKIMDQKSRTILIGGALLLQLIDQAQKKPQHDSQLFWFRGDLKRSDHHAFAEVVKGLLDSMSLLLVPKPGGPFVTACGLDLPLVNQCADLTTQSTLKCPTPDDAAPATGPKCTEAIAGNGDQGPDPPNFTLRIARNGRFSDDDNKQLIDIATKIITFLETGGRFHTQPSICANSNISV